jgi:Pg-II fimbriae c
MKKNFFAAALILSLGVGSFAACSSDDIPQTEQKKKTTTMMKVALRMPAASGTRTPTDEPNNYIGEWLGQEKVEKIEVFVFNGTAGTDKLEAHETYSGADFSASLVGSDFVISPNKGIAVSAGTKQVYVVVNPNAVTTAHLGTLTLGVTDLTTFEAKYNGVAEVAAATGVANAPAVATDNSTAGYYAKLEKNGSTNPAAWKNVIVMTGENAGTGGAVIDDNVSEADAVGGIKNVVPIKVKRVVARVAVTTDQASFTLLGDDPYIAGVGTADPLGKVTGFTYVAAQGERKLNFTQKEAAAPTAVEGAYSYKWNSPAHDFISDDNYGKNGQTNAADALKNYDYAPLWQKDATAPADGLLGHSVPLNTTITGIVNPNLTPGAANAEAIGKLMEGDFLLPTTHKYNAATPTNPTDAGYYKGNTAYVLIRAIFTPEKIMVDKDPTAPLTAGAARPFRPSTPESPTAWTAVPTTDRPKTLVRGANGKFYSTIFASQDPMYQGVTGQAVEIFQAVKDGAGEIQGYKMLYFAWVNPDNVYATGANAGKWINSAVYRNNIYHVQLTGVTGTGLSWNPLVPAVPGTPGHDSDDPNHPNNPDPKPAVPVVNVPNTPGPQVPTTPTTPVTPPNTPTPVTPSTPLTPNKTFMAVKTTVLPWQVHGYKFPLHNQ